MKKLLFLLCVVFLIAGCGQGMSRKIDATSKESFQKSMKAINEELKGDEKEKFHKALNIILFQNNKNLVDILSKISNNINQHDPNFFAPINGKTPKDIITMAIDRTAKQIKELENKKAAADQSKEILKKITISNPVYRMVKNFYLAQPIISFQVTNNTGKALSRIYYHGIVASPGRSVPWINEDFNNEISGGIENGESKKLSLSPNMFSAWGNKEAGSRADIVFTVTVVNAEDASQKKLATDFGNTEELQLKEQINIMNKLKS